MSDFVDRALSDCGVVSVAVRECGWSPIQRALVGLAPVGVSISASVRELVRLGYIPSAKILLRPLVERVVTIEYLLNNSDAVDLWASGWPKSKRPSLAALLSAFERGHPQDWALYQKFIVADMNDAIHPNPVGDDKFRSPNGQGDQVFWFNTVPNAHVLASEVCAANMMAAVFFSSQMKRAFLRSPKI
jgi:hypothetical protein